jgi:hypothetical protein
MSARKSTQEHLAAGDQDQLGPRHTRSRRLVALMVAVFLLAITVLAAGYSLFRAPPVPDRTRPLPPVIPEQGAVR